MKYNEMNYEQRDEIAELFESWLGMYTEEVIAQVAKRTDEIINDDFSMNLIRELKVRQDKEKEERIRDFAYILGRADGTTFGVHNHSLTHSKSYRDVLYDMYIMDIII